MRNTLSDNDFISLGKDAGLSLRKDDGLSKISVILGWDKKSYEGDFDFDLDAEAFLLNKDGRVRNNQDLVFYHNLSHVSGAVEHQGDNSVLKGGDADGEVINVDLAKIPNNVEKIVFTVTIDDAEFREQNFSMAQTFISIVDDSSGEVLVNCQLNENYGEATALVVGEIVRHQGIWKFRPLKEGLNGTLFNLCERYGVKVK